MGQALLQLGRLAGLELYATAPTPKHAAVAAHGAKAIDYRQEEFVARVRALTGDGVDVGGRRGDTRYPISTRIPEYCLTLLERYR